MSVGDLPRAVCFDAAVRVRLGAERGFVFDQRTGRVYSLNASAALAAERIQSAASLTAVVAAVVEAFEVDAATAGRDLATFVAQLVEAGLVTIDG